jgi:hypothetical protein
LLWRKGTSITSSGAGVCTFSCGMICIVASDGKSVDPLKHAIGSDAWQSQGLMEESMVQGPPEACDWLARRAALQEEQTQQKA